VSTQHGRGLDLVREGVVVEKLHRNGGGELLCARASPAVQAPEERGGARAARDEQAK
jgi:hypothetical protein